MNDIVKQGTDAWAEGRRAGLGGSEVAVLYASDDTRTGTVHPWMSPYNLWAIKTGRTKSVKAHPIETPALWWGQRLEDDVREAYEIITGRKIESGVTMARHPELDIMVANTDGTVVDPERGRGVYEGKTTARTRADEWEQGVPLYYQIQVQHYLAVTGLSWGSVAVRIDGERQPIRFADVERNDRFIADLMDRIDRWWTRHIIADMPPPVDGSRATTSTISELFPEPTPGQVVTLGDEWLEVQMDIDNLDSQIKALEMRKSAAQNRLKAAIGDGEYGRLPDGSGWSFKQTHRKASTRVIPAATYRTLRTVKSIDNALRRAARKKDKS